MLQEYIQFITELKDNNNKVWFDVNRERWGKIRKDWLIAIQDIIHEIAKFDDLIAFTLPKQCVYRINRDVRFSNNKNPYKDYISAVFCPQGKKDGCIAYYFEITPFGDLITGGGWYEIDPKRLLAVRNHIAENLDDITELRGILQSKPFVKTYHGISEVHDLKTHPKGFSKESANLDLLKHRNFIASKQRKLVFKNDADFAKIVAKDLKDIAPFIKFLRKWENIS